MINSTQRITFARRLKYRECLEKPKTQVLLEADDDSEIEG